MKTLKIKTLMAIAGMGLAALPAVSQETYGEIRGMIKNTDLEIVPYATVKILQGNILVGGVQSDERGIYHYKPLPQGTYEIIAMSTEYLTQTVKGVIIKPNAATYVDIKMNPNTMETVTVIATVVTYTPPGVGTDMYSMLSVDYKDLKLNAAYESGNINSGILALTSDVMEGSDGELHFRGSRGDASSNFVDGVRTYGQTTVPGLAIENLTVYTGGVPACYGDVTAGVVIINTKSYFSGIREKHLRENEYRESRAEEKKMKQNKEAEENRAKEIEAEKKKEKQ